MAKKKTLTKRELIYKLDHNLNELEKTFIIRMARKVKGWINKIINNDNNIYSLGKEDIDGLRLVIQNYYKAVGSLAITETNKELKHLVKNKRVVFAPDNARIDLSYLAKEKALERVRAFQTLVRDKINNLPVTGREKADIQRAIRGSFNLYKARHITTPAQTESIDIVNTQRLDSFSRSRVVAGVQFLAVIDRDTTEICSSRNGKILKLDDPQLAFYTPPLHFNCRSYLSPVTIYEQNVKFNSKSDLENVPDPIFDKSENRAITVNVTPRENLNNLIQPSR